MERLVNGGKKDRRMQKLLDEGRKGMGKKDETRSGREIENRRQESGFLFPRLVPSRLAYPHLLYFA